MWNDMSISHSLPNGLLVTCDRCKNYRTQFYKEPCKTCLENQRLSLDREVPLQCFFESDNPNEYEALADFISKHKEFIRELYRDSVVLGVSITKLISLMQYRDILCKYFGSEPPIDILKEAEDDGVSMENLLFQLRRNSRLLIGRAPYATESERKEMSK